MKIHGKKWNPWKIKTHFHFKEVNVVVNGKYWDEKLGYVLFKDGEFCGFSTNYDEDSLGQYPVALVKLPDGKMIIPRVEHIQFTDTAPPKEKEEDITPQRFPQVRNDCGDKKRKYVFSNA